MTENDDDKPAQPFEVTFDEPTPEDLKAGVLRGRVVFRVPDIVQTAIAGMLATLRALPPMVGPSTKACPGCGAAPAFIVQPFAFPVNADGRTIANLVSARCKHCEALVLYVHDYDLEFQQ